MKDPTAQTEPLTTGQQIVSAWERDIIAEPCELAVHIDSQIAAAYKRGVYDSAQLVESKYGHSRSHGHLAMLAEDVAQAIRSLSPEM